MPERVFFDRSDLRRLTNNYYGQSLGDALSEYRDYQEPLPEQLNIRRPRILRDKLIGELVNLLQEDSNESKTKSLNAIFDIMEDYSRRTFESSLKAFRSAKPK